MLPRFQAEGVPDGFAALAVVLVGVDVDHPVELSIEVDLGFPARCHVRPDHDRARALEADGRLGALLRRETGLDLALTALVALLSPATLPLPAWVGDADPLYRRAVVVPNLELGRFRFLGLHHNPVAFHSPAGALNQSQGTLLGAVDNRAKGEVGIAELLVGNRRNPALPDVGDLLIPEHHAEDAGGAGRIAVGVLPGPGRDLDRFAEVAVAEQQPEHDVGSVQLGVDVERPQRAVRTRVTLVPLVLD